MIETESLLEKLSQARKPDMLTWQPFILSPKKQPEEIEQILTERQPVVVDEFYDQVTELVKCLNPRKRLSGEKLDDAVRHWLGDKPMELQGNWAYYPWNNKLVHILDEENFIIVRTNRNHYKISPEESKLLATRKVGLIGLSVGQSVALTMAMERCFGELRITDFDSLELTNLNRIRTGVHNLGLSKVLAVAREIKEIDPYLKVTCYPDGLNEENMDSFFSEGGNLDLLIDECDGLDMKILARHKAKSLGIPVVMEASDRGMVDVERFDLEPERPLLHGMVGDLNPEKLRSLESNEDKIPYMLDIVGIETISTRAKASMLEIGETISTWPQLASAVTLGGGITADVIRRIFLNQFKDSGRYYVDVEQLIGNKPEKNDYQKEQANAHLTPVNFGPEPPKSPIKEPPVKAVERIAEAACHAPSGGNLQPWRWQYAHGTLQLYQDARLISSFLDHNFIASYVALGASIENARLQALNEGFEANVRYFPEENDNKLIAHMQFEKLGNTERENLVLAKNIYRRETNRNLEPGKNLSTEHQNYLKKLAAENGSELVLIDDEAEKAEMASLIAFAERFRILHPTGHKNFIEEMRWSAEDAERTRDGIDISTVDLSPGELAGFKLARHREVIDKIVEWEGGTAFEKLSRKSTGAAPVLGIITRPEHSATEFLKAGRDMERLWIGANEKGIGFQPQSPLSLILQRLEGQHDLNPAQARELQKASDALDTLMQKHTVNQPVFIFRLFYAEKPVVRSWRRDITEHFQMNL